MIFRQLKTASLRAFIFSCDVVCFQRATYASQCKLRRSFNVSHKKYAHITHKNTRYISSSGGFRDKGNFVLQLSSIIKFKKST